MGMFDYIIGKCPNCGERTKDQSKAGLCELKTYSVSSLPADIAMNIKRYNKEGNIYCENCNTNLTYSIPPIPRVSAKLIVKGSNDDENVDYD